MRNPTRADRLREELQDYNHYLGIYPGDEYYSRRVEKLKARLSNIEAMKPVFVMLWALLVLAYTLWFLWVRLGDHRSFDWWDLCSAAFLILGGEYWYQRIVEGRR